MSQPGPQPTASPRPRRGAAARHTQEHVTEKNIGSSSKPGEKKGSDEKKAASAGSSQPSRAHAGGATTATKVTASSAASCKSPSMSSTEAKVLAVSKQMEGPHPPDKKRHRKQAVKTESEKSQPSENETKEKRSSRGDGLPPNVPKPASDTRSTRAHKEKTVSRSNEQMVSEKSADPKTKSEDIPSAGGGKMVAGVTVAEASDKAIDKKKEEKSLTPASSVASKLTKPADKSGMDAALDDLIDSLGEPEDSKKDDPPYTGPVVLDPMYSTYTEELGKKEGTIPPEYRKLLDKKEGIATPPPESPKPMGTDDAIDALSSDFTCSSPTGKQTEKEKSTGEVLKAQSAGVTRSAVSPQEKKKKIEEEVMSDQAVQALSDSLSTRQPDPESHPSPVHQVKEEKRKEKKQEKCGEDDDTVPSEYRLKPATDKDGKPLLPEPEEKSKCLSESELIGKLSEDFGQSTYQDKPSMPAEKIQKSKETSPTPVAEPVLRASMCSIQTPPPKPTSSKGMMPDDAVEALAGSLGKREADPEDEKPLVDKVKEKAKEEDHEKLGEKEETIPPDYRLEEVKGKDGKPLLPKQPREQVPPLSDDFLLDALSQDFSSPVNIPSLEFEDAKLSAAISEVVSQTPAPSTYAAALPPDTEQSNKDIDEALDKLSDSLGQREPDPDENKPLDDKVKEKVKMEHREKLGERDDTIPPEYRHLLDNDGQDKPEKPPTKKSKKPDQDQDPIDALSEDLDNCPSTAKTSQNTAKEKSKKTSGSKTPKKGVKTKDSSKTEEVSKPKADENAS
ncbi:calpastatin isoform X5 [Psammomys obesus]|uniref:calpastatin isoform X5 n=1 Tax=Psammomys obesus TaxID=48139 RepID=UPI002452E0B2|nr:calpastatin isoform X5 [Psammomys obesus]